MYIHVYYTLPFIKQLAYMYNIICIHTCIQIYVANNIATYAGNVQNSNFSFTSTHISVYES